MIACTENTKESIVKLLDLMSEFGKALTINKIDRSDDIKVQRVSSSRDIIERDKASHRVEESIYNT